MLFEQGCNVYLVDGDDGMCIYCYTVHCILFGRGSFNRGRVLLRHTSPHITHHTRPSPRLTRPSLDITYHVVYVRCLILISIKCELRTDYVDQRTVCAHRLSCRSKALVSSVEGEEKKIKQ